MGVETGRVAIRAAGLLLPGARSVCAGGHIEPRPFLGDPEEIPMPGVGAWGILYSAIRKCSWKKNSTSLLRWRRDEQSPKRCAPVVI